MSSPRQSILRQSMTGVETAVETAAEAPVRPLPAWVLAVLRVPLAAKLAGANVLIVLGALAAALAVRGGTQAGTDVVVIVGLALIGSFLVNVGLVVLALQPLQALETTAGRVWSGDLGARVQPSLLADARVARVGRTMNILLDGLMADRARTRRLAAEIIHAGERERASIARELHDSVAQSLAALVMQISVVIRDCTEPALIPQLETIRTIGTDALEEIRLLAHTTHPRVLDDLGLLAALQHLARQTTTGTDATVTVDAPDLVDTTAVAPPIASVLYRVAQEAVNNAVRHGHAKTVVVRVRIEPSVASSKETSRVMQRGAHHQVTLDVHDDGCGFDVADAERRRPGMGLFTMRERVVLVDGNVEITSKLGEGTHVTATIPLDMTSAPEGQA